MNDLYTKKPWLKNKLQNVPEEVEVPLKSLGEVFDDAAAKWKGRTAVHFYGADISYKELKEKVDCFANALSQLGLKKGDRLGLLLLNSPEFIISFYASAKIGLIMTPISPVYVSSEIRHQLSDSGAESIICQDILYESVEKTGIKLKNVILASISDSLPKFKKLLGRSVLRGVYQKMAVPSPEIYQGEGFYNLHQLIGKYPPTPPPVEINPREDLIALPYTGGTTGLPKGVMLTHYNMVANYRQFKANYPMLIEGQEATVAYMPFYHAASQITNVVYGLLNGFTQVAITNPDVDDILNSMVHHNVSCFTGAPTIFEILKDYEKTDKVNWKKMKIIVSGADSLHENTAKGWEERTRTRITEAYGQTETTCLSTINPKGAERYGSVGIPVAGTMVAILDPDEDRYLPFGEIGEVVINGPQITRGYWKRPDATKECEAIIHGTRWWRTGDLGSMDEDGFIYIYDRKRDLIKYKGLRVYAREVEEVLKGHPKVKEVGVVGEPDIKVGENVKAVIVLESDARGKISEAEIRKYCEDKLAHYKIPKIVEFVGEIPKTDIGKVSRREIRAHEEA